MPPTVVKLVPMPTLYQTANAKVVLDVTVGEKQKGRIKVSLDGVELTRADDIKGFAIGDGPALVGKTLQVLSTVAVTNQNSGRTIVTSTLSGGAQKEVFPSPGPNGVLGDVVEFQAKFLFE